jgi:hypothetical protein
VGGVYALGVIPLTYLPTGTPVNRSEKSMSDQFFMISNWATLITS